MAGAKGLTKKTPEDFAKMEIAGRCVAAVHDAVRAAIAPGVTTAALDAIGAEVVRDHGCRPSFLGYHGFPATICTSPNRAIVHGIPGDYVLRDGDIISIDAGAIYEGWHGDAAFTAAVGDVPDEVQKLIDATEEAVWNGLRQARVGKRLGDIVLRRLAVIDPGDRLTPPLQADHAEHRLRDLLAGARDFVVEGVQREQRLAPRGGGEQRAQVAVGIEPPHFGGAIRKRACPGHRLKVPPHDLGRNRRAVIARGHPQSL